jgi:S-adenosylmethionine hydrolase
VSRFITMLTDFGHRDAYVGIMKSVMHGICPDCTTIDLCHDVPAQNVLSGAFLLSTTIPFLPKDAVVLAVVDPGVGTPRRAVAVETEDVTLIGPDNGLFTLVLERTPAVRAFELSNPDYQLPRVSSTFHGRDIFSPAAAHVAAGVDISEFGPEVDLKSLVRFPEIGPIIKENSVECRVVHIDHFGNCITNLSREAMDRMEREPRHVKIGSEVAPFHVTFGDVKEGEAVCYFNSSDYLEVGIRNRDAAEQFELKPRSMINVVTD